MEHVRLPLVSKEYLLENVVDEPLLKNDPKCMFFFLIKYMSLLLLNVYNLLLLYF